MPSVVSTRNADYKHGSSQQTRFARLKIWVCVLLLLCSTTLLTYSALSLYIATKLTVIAPQPITHTPASLGLAFRSVTYPSRDDHLPISAWLIPGVLPDGSLTLQRTIIMAHGSEGNRANPVQRLLDLSGDFARRGFAVLTMDLRGHGESSPAPLSLGYFEQRDILGAVDFLHSGLLPYPALGRPQHIFGWGISMGGTALLLAAVHEPAIEAIVSDCAYADIIPILEREIPKQGHLPAFFTPGALQAARILYGMDLYSVRPITIVASLAPRPIFFIHGQSDPYIPPINMTQLATAARNGHNTHVQTWLVPGAGHAQSFFIAGNLYVQRIVKFYNQALTLTNSMQGAVA